MGAGTWEPAVRIEMRVLSALVTLSVLLGGSAGALADACPGRPDALGTSRVITVDPAEHSRIGTMQYHETLPLADKEVVLTFDDGPLPPYTSRVLETLAAECVKATFFMVGRQARAYPDMVRRVYNEGHTIGSHSQNHPRIFTRLPAAGAEDEIEQGVAAIAAALGDAHALAPFFRFPGLGRSPPIETYLGARGIMSWSADFLADDWTHISAQKVLARALDRIERKRKGILLLHDIQPATALALPALLRVLKARGYRIVHVMPAGPERPKTVTEPDGWVMHRPAPPSWPRIVEPARPPELPAPSRQGFGYPQLAELEEGASLPSSQSADAWPGVSISAVPALGAPLQPALMLPGLGPRASVEWMSFKSAGRTIWPGARRAAARGAKSRPIAAHHRGHKPSRATAPKPPHTAAPVPFAAPGYMPPPPRPTRADADAPVPPADVPMAPRLVSRSPLVP